MNFEEQLEQARAEGAEKMRALCVGVDPYRLHMEGAPFARDLSSVAAVLQVLQEGILALPNPYGGGGNND